MKMFNVGFFLYLVTLIFKYSKYFQSFVDSVSGFHCKLNSGHCGCKVTQLG